MMKNVSSAFLLLLVCFAMTSCEKDAINNMPEKNVPYVHFILKLDSTQIRLNNKGQAATIPAGNAAQSPVFNQVSIHYIELAQNAFTPLGSGAVIYHAPETVAGNDTAIDFNQSVMLKNGDTIFSIPANQIENGQYSWLRVSLAYQNYKIKYRFDTVVNGFSVGFDTTGVIASFVGYNTYISDYTIDTKKVTLNASKKQGYWGFETNYSIAGINQNFLITGQAPAGATTVVNPLFATSPIPAGSCVVTSALKPNNLNLKGNETNDIVIEVSLSTNKSFEWKDNNNNGKWDISKNEPVVDMGVRGMISTIK